MQPQTTAEPSSDVLALTRAAIQRADLRVAKMRSHGARAQERVAARPVQRAEIERLAAHATKAASAGRLDPAEQIALAAALIPFGAKGAQ